MTIDTAETFVSTREAAHLLGISKASVTNWVKHGYLTPLKRNSFSYTEVMALKDRIMAGTVQRLNKRANKSQSGKTFLPEELMINKRDKAEISRVIHYILAQNIHGETALFLLAINLLQKKQLLPHNIPLNQIRSGVFTIPGMRNLLKDLGDWHRNLPRNVFTEKAFLLLDFDLAEQQDLLGIIYQSIIKEGNKATRGSYYTPYPVVEQIARETRGNDFTLLDPCCGTGQFLLAFAGNTNNPSGLYGIDTDPIAVRIAKINLFLQFPETDFMPAVYCGDALLGEWNLPRFDVIATNPPWGYHFTPGTLHALEEHFPVIRSGESFSYFLVQGINLLSAKGKLVYLLPEAILNVKTHEDIREYILTNSRLCGIRYLKKRFTNVFSPVIMLELDKQKRGKKTIIRKKQGSPFKIDSSRFASNPGKIFDVHMETMDEELITRIYRKKHITLKDGADWALGIVTGDNARYVHAEKQGFAREAVYKGRDIKPFGFLPPSGYISFKPSLYQQVAPEGKYRAKEKLIYKFISHRLVFAHDTEQRLTLNSANILIPMLPDYPVKVILGLFNSTLYQFIFQKKFNAIKVLRSHLEQLPLPLMEATLMEQILHRVDQILQGENTFPQLDELTFSFFGISRDEQDYIRRNIK